MKTSEIQQTLPNMPETSTSLQEDTPASHSASPGSKKALKTTATSGRQCLKLLNSSDPFGCLLKMLLVTSSWGSTRCYLTWKPKATPHGRLLFQLAPSTPPTDATEYGLLATPNTMDSLPPRSEEALQRQFETTRKGRTKPANLREQIFFLPTMMLPTPGANEGKGASRNRFYGSPNYHGAKTAERLRTGEDCPIYCSPSFLEAVMGYPIGWTELES